MVKLFSVFPFPGVYFFAFSLHASFLRNQGITQGALIMDGEYLASVYCYNNDIDTVSSNCANSFVAYCNAGQEVKVISDYNGNVISGDADNRRSTFTGFLLRPEN